MHRIPVDLSSIIHELGGQLTVSVTVPIEPIELGAEHFEPAGPAELEAVVANTGSGFVATGTASARFHATCSRCLAEFVLPVTAQIDGFYIHSAASDEIPEDQEYELVEGEHIDLWAALKTALTLQLPFAPLHAEECKGLCPVCGVDLNEETCSCVPSAEDSPFSALRNLLPRDDGERD